MEIFHGEKELPGILYHYCDTYAFTEILTQKQIWLSNAFTFNDYYENIWVDKVIDRVLREIINDANKDAIDRFLNLYRANKQLSFVCSFSENGDSLSQWRGYTNNASGMAIGFSPINFGIDYRLPSNNFETEKAKSFFKCIYNEDEQFEITRAYTGPDFNRAYF